MGAGVPAPVRRLLLERCVRLEVAEAVWPLGDVCSPQGLDHEEKVKQQDLRPTQKSYQPRHSYSKMSKPGFKGLLLNHFSQNILKTYCGPTDHSQNKTRGYSNDWTSAIVFMGRQDPVHSLPSQKHLQPKHELTVIVFLKGSHLITTATVQSKRSVKDAARF